MKLCETSAVYKDEAGASIPRLVPLEGPQV